MTVSYDLSDKVAVVAGGAGGIGGAIVSRLSMCGARVWIWDLAAVEDNGIHSVMVNLTDPERVAEATELVLEQADRIDILVNSAGYLGAYVPFERLAPEDGRRIIDVNLVGVLEVCRQIIPVMRRAGRGRIVNIGSLAGKQGLANLAVYSAVSAGVIAFTKALAQELASTDIRINCVTPGPIATKMIRNLGTDVVDSMIASSPMRRLGTADEVAELVVWLCSDAPSFSTGAVFDVSGGRASY